MSIATWFENLPLTSTTVLAVVDVVAVLLALVLVTRPRGARVWWRILPLVVVIGAVLGGVLIWYVGDVQNAFGVTPTWVDRIWTGAVVAGLAVAVANVVLARWRRKIVAVVAMIAFLLAGALAINRDVDLYLTPGQLLGTAQAPDLRLPSALGQKPGTAVVSLGSVFNPFLYRTWHPPLFMPKTGKVGQVVIPATISHFAARPAEVYLPPAALVKNGPALPVVILMSGQPASPDTVMVSGGVPATLNALAARNHGLAPIVVVPDQLGPSAGNPMCVDGALGNSATYITRDVPDWIRTHLHVESSRLAWTVGGFSQGGTCSIQFGAAEPRLFGSILDVSGEEYPTLTTDQMAIDQGFGGSAAAYDRAKPATILARHAPYPDTAAFFAVGETDRQYGRSMTIVSADARSAGMAVTRYVVPGGGHDWSTASLGFARGFADLYPRWGLAKAALR
ncbi:hypothetical protein AS850_08430 [Frondihabitans sp. 762G35]|uniref:alpha/beta hydrolase n=1 Tax=Frondihabitans sp. 762G35 TaxID=1446794 RepID=UPI000D205DA0|nr:alpha/beta hydrolase-fold protein [Frondihabitans sp. 762G35]ARC57098.1 hypothetical protein AS850_08430 [Frondihabitans sp. 762G35]